jgi:hypothetical protein
VMEGGYAVSVGFRTGNSGAVRRRGNGCYACLRQSLYDGGVTSPVTLALKVFRPCEYGMPPPRSRRDFRLIWKSPRRDLPLMSTKPRNLKVSDRQAELLDVPYLGCPGRSPGNSHSFGRAPFQ